MKFQLLALSVAVLASQSVWAKPVSQAPGKCPSVQSFIQSGVSDASPTDEDVSKWWGIEEKSNFDTDQPWMFFVGAVKAASKSEALSKANAAIPTLQFTSGPEENGNVYLCFYRGEGVSALAVNGMNDYKQSLIKRFGV